jgi:hypothetical protein
LRARTKVEPRLAEAGMSHLGTRPRDEG